MLGLLLALAACPATDARQMLADAGQGFNGRVLEVREDRLVIEAESTFKRSIAFGEKVTVYGRALPASEAGRIGIVVHRRKGRWTASRCDVVPGARMALAISGDPPCPKPRVRIASVVTDRRTATLHLSLRGDVTGLRFDWAGVIVRRPAHPGQATWTERHTFRDSGRRRVSVRVTGGGGAGCGTRRASSHTAARVVHVD